MLIFNLLQHLCMALLAGPKWPKPDAIVLISTCFQQQKAQGFSFSLFPFEVTKLLHLDSNIKSLRNMPKEMRFNGFHALQYECFFNLYFIFLFNFFFLIRISVQPKKSIKSKNVIKRNQ